MPENPNQLILHDLFEHARFEFCGFDPITGLVGKVFFELELKSRIYEYVRYETPLCLCSIKILGIDSLDRNPANIASLFHDIGQIIGGDLRLADRATWYAADSFAVLLPHTKQENADQILNRLREKIDAILMVQSPNSLHGVVKIAEARPGVLEEELLDLVELHTKIAT